jgi:hypothetical protein
LPEVTRRSALVANQMKHIPKPFNNEQAENSSSKEHTGRVVWLVLFSIQGGKAISDLQTHYRQYKERREIGVLLFSRRRFGLGRRMA